MRKYTQFEIVDKMIDSGVIARVGEQYVITAKFEKFDNSATKVPIKDKVDKLSEIVALARVPLQALSPVGTYYPLRNRSQAAKDKVNYLLSTGKYTTDQLVKAMNKYYSTITTCPKVVSNMVLDGILEDYANNLSDTSGIVTNTNGFML